MPNFLFLIHTVRFAFLIVKLEINIVCLIDDNIPFHFVIKKKNKNKIREIRLKVLTFDQTPIVQRS